MMSDKNNEEKLKILRERLNQIHEKKKTENQPTYDHEKTIAPSVKESKIEEFVIESSNRGNSKIKYFILFFTIITLVYLGYEYIDLDSFSKKNEIINEIDNNIKNEINEEITDDENLIYYKSKFNGDYIIVLKSFEDISKANNHADSLKIEGLNCEVLQLSGVSNSSKEIFQTYIQGSDELHKNGMSFIEKAEANQYKAELEKNHKCNGTVITLQ